MKNEEMEYTFQWSEMSELNQYAALSAYTKGMTEAASEVMYMAIEAVDPMIVFNSDFSACKVHDDSAPKLQEFIMTYLNNR